MKAGKMEENKLGLSCAKLRNSAVLQGAYKVGYIWEASIKEQEALRK